jgi:hypothetical protein
LTKKETVETLVAAVVELGAEFVREDMGINLPLGIAGNNPAEYGHGPVVHY